METEINLELGRQILARQPFSVSLGAQLMAFEPGRAELVIPTLPEHMQQNGFVHGGVLSYAADNTLTFAGGSALGPQVVTSEYKVNFLRPANGERLVARAKVIYAGKTQAVCRCEIYDVKEGQEILCAVAQGTITRIGSQN